jgi:pyruvate formate lyase activating enzyme
MPTLAPVFDIQSLATHDGAGLRTLVFLKGCPLRCTWCANPEGQMASPQLRWHVQRCVGELACAGACPNGAVASGDGGDRTWPRFERTICQNCEDRPCIAACPQRALDVAGHMWDADRLFSELKKDMRLFWNTGGGVTFSGGEPLLYTQFIGAVADRLCQFSVSADVETCGYWEWDQAARVLGQCETIFFDLKTLDDEVHRRFTSQSNAPILANLTLLARSYAHRVVVSLPIIPGVSDTLGHVSEVAGYVLARGLRRVRLLPYHRMGLSKYEALGLEYPHRYWDRPVDIGLVHEMQRHLSAAGLDVTVEG